MKGFNFFKKNNIVCGKSASHAYIAASAAGRRGGKGDDEEDEPQQESGGMVKITQQQAVNNIFNIYIYGEIGYCTQYIDVLELLHHASPADTIHIFINTPGGILDTAFDIVSAIRTSEADVHVFATGTVASAGTLLWLAPPPPNRHVMPYAKFMFHVYSTITGGKAQEIVSKINFQHKFYYEIFREFYAEILSEEELTRFFNADDVWVAGDTISKRNDDLIEKLIEQLKKEAIEGVSDEDEEDDKEEDEDETMPVAAAALPTIDPSILEKIPAKIKKKNKKDKLPQPVKPDDDVEVKVVKVPAPKPKKSKSKSKSAKAKK